MKTKILLVAGILWGLVSGGVAFATPIEFDVYAVDDSTDELLRINPISGESSVIGSVGFSSVRGLAYNWATGILYGADSATNQLIKIDRVTGTGTAIGSRQGKCGEIVSYGSIGLTNFANIEYISNFANHICLAR